MASEWTESTVVAALRADAEVLGRPPTSYDWTDSAPGRPTAAVVSRVFGSWPAARKAAGLDEPDPGWNADRIIKALQEDAKERGRAPTFTEWTGASDERPTAHWVVMVFDSWEDALSSAGLESGWSKDRIIELLRKDADVRGDRPTFSDWGPPAPGRPGASTIKRIFGSWSAALDAAGLRSAPQGKVSWTRERIIEAMKKDAEEHGSHPRPGDWRAKGPGRPTTEVVRRRFGTWADAIAAAGLHDWPERGASSKQVDFTFKHF